MPYPCTTSHPSRLPASSASSADSGAAPENTCSSAERSNWSTSGCLARATTMGGATKERVMPYSWCSRRNCSRSKRGMVMTVAPARKPRVHEDLHAVDVEERQDGDDLLVLAQVCRNQNLRDVRDQIPVGEHDALRRARGARGVRQGDDVVGVHRHLLGQRRAEELRERPDAVGQGRGRVRPEHVHRLDGGALGGLEGGLEEQRHGDEQPRAGVEELVVDLALGVRGVDRRDDARRRRPRRGRRRRTPAGWAPSGRARRPGAKPRATSPPARARTPWSSCP